MLFSACSLVGLFIFAVSASLKDLTMAYIGRAIYGIGAECQNVWFATIISIWFHHGEVAFATAALSAFGKGGSLISSFISPLTFREWGGIQGGFWLSFLINCLAFVAAIVINQYDEEKDEMKNKIKY